MFLSGVSPRSLTLRSSRCFHLPIGVFRKTDRAGFGDPSSRAAILTPSPMRSPSLSSTTSPRWMPIAKFNALVGRDLGVALDHRPLDFNGAVHCVDDAAEFDDIAVAGALDDAAVMHCDGGVDQVAAKGPKASEDSIFIRTRKPRVADDVGHQDRRELSGLAHGASAEAKVVRGSLALVSSSSIPDVITATPFDHDVHHRGF